MRFILLSILLTFTTGISAKDTSKKILWVGNSFSFYHNGVHNHTSNLVRAAGKWQGRKDKFRLLTISGGKLHEYKKLLNQFLEAGETQWDFIVLQEYSNGPLQKDNNTGFFTSAKSLIKDVRHHKAEPVLFMTWAYGNKPDMTQGLAKSYNKAGADNKTPVIPVGLAFAAAQKKYPDINLFKADLLGVKDGKLAYKRDLKHPSLAGSYLAACVFYSYFYQESPEGNMYSAGLPKTVIRKLQKLSWEIVSKSR